MNTHVRTKPVVLELSAAQAILQILEAEGVQYIFGVPGGPLTSFFEALEQRGKIRFVLAKHEGAAAYMAAAHARATGTLGVCCVTSGPGATNALTGIASAHADSIPVLLLTGQVATHVFGKGAIQESSSFGTDLVELFRPVTLLSAMFPAVTRVPDLLRSAIRTALTGRRGPVHLSMPADMLARPVQYAALEPRQYRAQSTPVDQDGVALAARLLAHAERPLVLAGHGVALSGASAELLKLARTEGIPVATSPKGKGTFPEHEALSLGVLGFGGHELAEKYLETADVLFVVGSSLNEFVTNGWTVNIPPQTAIVQLDIDPGVIGRNYPVEVAIVGDARATLAQIGAELVRSAAPRSSAHETLAALRERTPRYLAAAALDDEQSPLKPQRLMRELRAAMPDDMPLFVDNGTSIIWATHYFEARRPRTYFIDLGLAAMGSAVAGVVGGALAASDRRAVALVGDAAFAMHGMEVHTAVEQRLPVVWLVLNNGGHGMVHQGETIMRGADLGTSVFRVPIDSAALARALGAQGVRVESPGELRSALDRAFLSDRPTVIDAVIDPNELAPTLVRRAETLARFFALRRRTDPPASLRPAAPQPLTTRPPASKPR
jgi:acetolactate synthase-1/2/3 large subunit